MKKGGPGPQIIATTSRSYRSGEKTLMGRFGLPEWVPAGRRIILKHELAASVTKDLQQFDL